MQKPSASRMLFTSLAVTLACVVLTLSACSDGSDGMEAVDAATAPSVPSPGPDAAAAGLEEGRTVIDVRTPEEYEAGHIDEATLVNFQASTFAEDVAGLDPEVSYVVYCRSGNRSAQAATEMRAAGLDVIDGGAMSDMEEAGWPVAP